MSQSARDLPKKPANLMKVDLLHCHCHRHQYRDYHRGHQQQRQKQQRHHHSNNQPSNSLTSAVHLFARMALLMLANHCGLSSATTLVPSSQIQPSPHSSQPANHNRLPAAAAATSRFNASPAYSFNEISTFEWPRLKDADSGSTSEAQIDRNNSLEHAPAQAAHEIIEIERIHRNNETSVVAGQRANATNSQVIRLKNSNARVDAGSTMARISTSETRAEPANDWQRTVPRKVALDEAKMGQLTRSKQRPPDRRMLPNSDHNHERDDHHHHQHHHDDDDSRTNSSLPGRLIGNKSARSIHSERVSMFANSKTGGFQDESLAPATVEVAESNRIEQNPECALILKRTYILKQEADEWGDKFVFNDIDPDEQAEGKRKQARKIHHSDLCIKHSDVDKAMEEAKHRIHFQKPDDLDSFEVGERSLASIGELSLATGLLLTKRFDLSQDEIMNALPMIDMSSSKAYWNELCPKHVRPMVCARSRYRTITAHCNNLKHPSWGASKTPYSRYLPPDYADGLSAPRAAHNGEPLPSARLITSIVHRDSDEPSHDYSVLFADWGQLINHDITRVAVGEAPDCCPHLLKGLCMPIPVPPGDPLYSKHNVKCLKFERSLAAIRPKCLLGPRAQINLITSPVDASFVYGSTKQQAQRLRAHTGGKLKVLNFFDKHQLKPLLPPKSEEPDKDCVARPKHLFCFEAGDVRVNEQTHLTVLHTIYLREHNRLAKQLARLNLDWDDDKIYQETRHIVAACVQHVLVNEFLPLLLGNHHVNEYKLRPTGDGHWSGYDPSVTISTGTAFASAAFRYGHSMIEGVIRRLDPHTGQLIRSDALRHLFKRPFWLYEPGAVDQLLAGMLLTPAEQTDPWVSEELSGHLFQPPKARFGHDLAAINIQRGRDQGVPGYNDWREWCGLKRARSFDDLEPLLMHHTAMRYSKLYKHVDDIDLWSAGISERKLPGSAVGPTMACIIARQMLNYKRGDRFWYENPGQPSSFTADQLREIKKVTLAKILCANGDDLPRIQTWAMRLPHPIYNAKVPCESLPTINLKFWDSSLMEGLD